LGGPFPSDIQFGILHSSLFQTTMAQLKESYKINYFTDAQMKLYNMASLDTKQQMIKK
jgi:hypothetical protein